MSNHGRCRPETAKSRGDRIRTCDLLVPKEKRALLAPFCRKWHGTAYSGIHDISDVNKASCTYELPGTRWHGEACRFFTGATTGATTEVIISPAEELHVSHRIGAPGLMLIVGDDGQHAFYVGKLGEEPGVKPAPRNGRSFRARPRRSTAFPGPAPSGGERQRGGP